MLGVTKSLQLTCQPSADQGVGTLPTPRWRASVLNRSRHSSEKPSRVNTHLFSNIVIAFRIGNPYIWLFVYTTKFTLYIKVISPFSGLIVYIACASYISLPKGYPLPVIILKAIRSASVSHLNVSQPDQHLRADLGHYVPTV